MQNPPLGGQHNFPNQFQGQPQPGGVYGVPQQQGGFQGGNTAVGGAGRFNSGMPGGGLVQPRPGAPGGPQVRVGAPPGGMPGNGVSRLPANAMMSGPRGPVPISSGNSSMGSVIGGGAGGQPAAPGRLGGFSPSGVSSVGQKMPPGAGLGVLGSGAPGAENHEEPAPAFGAEDFPALGGGLGGANGIGNGGMGMMGRGMPGMLSAMATAKMDFQMAKEDFPALPGSMGLGGGVFDGSMDGMKGDGQQLPGQHLMQGAVASGGGGGQTGLGGAVRRPAGDGAPTKPVAAADRFGLMGLLSVIQMTNPDLTTLALGTDLTTLGLNLNSAESLYSTFASPWADGPSRREPEFSLPMCYYMQPPTLKSGHIQKFQLETLFYIFYMLPKDTLQAVAASELYSRDWKFHRDLKMWFHKQPSLATAGAPQQNRPNTYIYFDVNVWERRTYYDANKNLEQGFLNEEEVRLKH